MLPLWFKGTKTIFRPCENKKICLHVEQRKEANHGLKKKNCHKLNQMSSFDRQITGMLHETGLTIPI